MSSMVFLIVGFIGFIVSAIYTFKNKISFFKGVVLATAWWLIMFVISAVLEKIKYGVSPIDVSIELAFSQVKNAIDSLPQDVIATLSGGEPYDVFKATMLNQIDEFKNIFTMLYPAITIVGYAFLSYVLFMLIKNIMRLAKKDVSFIPDFNQLRLNKQTVLAYVISLALAFLLADTVPGNGFLNLQLILASYTMLCGVALIDRYIAQKIRHGIIRFIIYIVIMLVGGIFIGYVVQFAALMAIFDAFRKKPSDKSKWV